MYRSPLHLIPDIQLPQDTAAARRVLLLEKKKLMAEFELSGLPTITMFGQELNRQDVITRFDNLTDPLLLSYHLAIWHDSTLLHFLEEGVVTTDADWIPNPLLMDAGFLSFVSPHFAAAYNKLLQRVLTGNASPDELHALKLNKPLLLPADTETAYRYTTRFFIEKKNELLGIHYRAETGNTVTAAEIRTWCNDYQIHILNQLPDTFSDLRYMLANLLNGLCVIYDGRKENKLALAAIERAATIRVEDSELKDLIPANLGIIRSKLGTGLFNIDPNTGKKKPKIGLILAIFIVIIRFAGCFFDDDRSSNNYNTIPTFSTADLDRLNHKPGVLTYRSLLKGLQVNSSITDIDSLYGPGQEILVKPTKAGANIFSNLDLSKFNDTVSSYPGNKTSTLLVRNNTTWDAIVIYQLADTAIHAAYVPPLSSYTVNYTAPRFAVQLYAGKDWSDTIKHVFKHYVTAYYSNSHILHGGYSTRARTALDDTTGSPILTRVVEAGRAHADTMNIINATGGYDIFPEYKYSEDK